MRNIPEDTGGMFYHDLLNAQARSFYERMLQQIQNKDYSGNTRITISNVRMARTDYVEAYRALRDDHPEYFFLGNNVELQIRGNEGIIKNSVLYTPKKIESIQMLLRLYLSRITSGLEHRSMLEKERMLYERIVRKLTYEDRNDANDHNIVGPITEAKGVCEGYNALWMLCLRHLGIPCIKVNGKSKRGVNHCWSMVWVQETEFSNSYPVHCDVTWESMNQNVCHYDYLNLSDRQILKTHKEILNGALPKCKTEHFDFFHKTHCNFNNRKEMQQYIQERIQTKNRTPVYVMAEFAQSENEILQAVKQAVSNGPGKSWYIRINANMKTAVLTC